jgi:hypothetical protein
MPPGHRDGGEETKQVEVKREAVRVFVHILPNTYLRSENLITGGRFHADTGRVGRAQSSFFFLCSYVYLMTSWRLLS